MLGTKTTLRTHYDGGHGEPSGDTWNQCRHENKGGKAQDRDGKWDTQTCGERLKGLNKLFISGAGFWRCEKRQREREVGGGRGRKKAGKHLQNPKLGGGGWHLKCA